MKLKIGLIIKNKKMKYANKDVAIHYFTNPAMENESLGKIVDGVMHQVAREVPTRKVNTEYEADYTHKMGATDVYRYLRKYKTSLCRWWGNEYNNSRWCFKNSR